MGDGTNPTGPYIDEVNRIGRILMAAWESAEGTPVNASYVATFADMARAIVEDNKEKDGAITWGTTCLNCASLLDSSYADHVRAERAEARVADVWDEGYDAGWADEERTTDTPPQGNPYRKA